MTTRVDYIGNADVRIITSAQLAQAGLSAPDLIWNKANNYEIDVSDAVAAFLVAADNKFVIEGSALKFGDLYRLSELESVGAGIDQTLAKTEHNRWLTLIRQVGGIGGPAPGGITYSGGDVTDAWHSGSAVTWVLSDFLPSLQVGSDDTYNSAPLGPIRNAAITESTPGTFGGMLGASSTWLRAQQDGGHPAGSLWWPLTAMPSTSALQMWVGAWYNDGIISDANPYGEYIDTHLILTGFGAYVSRVQCGFTDKKFFIESARLSGTTMYMLGGQFNPPIDNVPGQIAYAESNDYDVIKSQLDMTHRVARVAHADLGTVASWQFWNGTTWTTDRSQAVELRDTDGRLINGSAGFEEVKAGHWVMVAHQMVDTHLDVYHAPAPQGPWKRHARVPLNVPVVGRRVQGGFVIGWHCKVIKHLAAPPEHSVAMMTCWPKQPGLPFLDQNIRRYAPSFTVVPWF